MTDRSYRENDVSRRVADMIGSQQSDRSQPVEPADATPTTHATPSEGSVQGAGTLTDEEREAIDVAAEAYSDDYGERFAEVLRNLLERLV